MLRYSIREKKKKKMVKDLEKHKKHIVEQKNKAGIGLQVDIF